MEWDHRGVWAQTLPARCDLKACEGCCSALISLGAVLLTPTRAIELVKGYDQPRGMKQTDVSLWLLITAYGEDLYGHWPAHHVSCVVYEVFR